MKHLERGDIVEVTHPLALGKRYAFKKHGMGGDLLFTRPNEDDVCFVTARDFEEFRRVQGNEMGGNTV